VYPQPHEPDDELSWSVRWRALRAAIRQFVTGRHVYLSTGCMAGRHDYCRSMVGAAGEKKPARSKFSGAACICWCHQIPGDVSGGR
jgi:hypothetical protein